MRLPRFPIKGKVPITVQVTEGIDENGVPNVRVIYKGECIYDESATTRYNADGTSVSLIGVAIIDGDIAPEVDKIAGDVLILNHPAVKIYKARRIRSVTGQVHHTELELM